MGQWKQHHTAAVLAFVVGVVFLGGLATQLDLTTDDGDPNRLGFWGAVILGFLLLSLMVLVGWGIAGRPGGILIDARNRISLSTFQIVVWTLVVLASYGGAFYTNLLAGDNPLKALNVSIPPELWVALGISSTSFLGSRVINTRQGLKSANTNLDNAAISQADATARGLEQRGELTVRTNPGKASWADLFASDYADDGMHVDVAKLQMFFFTIVLAFGYAAAVADLLINSTSRIADLPLLDDGFVTLLAISHGGYLAKKAAQNV